MSDSAETYEQYQARLKEEQGDMSKDEIKQTLEQRHEYVQDLDSLPSVRHNWVKRGIKVSCEGANHPTHSHYLVRR